MRILGLPLLEAFRAKHADSRGQLDAWQVDVERQRWRSPQDIKNRYRSADFLADNRVIFDIKGNAYRLVVKVRYQNDLVLVEWVGTHAEYSKKKWVYLISSG
jgi:mRNA interferase HigB